MDPDDPSSGNRGTMMLAVLAGAFGSLDSALNIAFPDLVDDLSLSVADLRWVVVCFVLSYGSLLVVAGRNGDRFDHRRVLMIGGTASAVALTACAAASSYEVLLGARVAQGLATALVMAGAPALLSTAGAGTARAASIFQAAAGAGLAIGPLVGGPLVALGGWRAVFWFRVPIAAALVLLGAAVKRASLRVSCDPPTIGPNPASPVVVADPPSRRTFVVANALTAIVNGVVFVTWLLVPTLLLDQFGLSAVAGGLVLAASPLATAMASARADRWVDRWGDSLVAVSGVAVSTAGLVLLAVVAAGERPMGLAAVTIALVVVGFGLGLFSVPNMALVMNAMPLDRRGTAGGLTLMMRTLGIVVGVNAAALLFGRLEADGWAFIDAFRLTFGASAAAGLGAVGLSVWGLRRGHATKW